ncbi:MAG: protoporphyrinogen oxidase [Acidobacteria bacterium]|jgi:oxygen-dependent protoporphyrinogen oxidase|nr:protoporphyrinogen oxidase [Acidobacteriota bacterium]
MAKRLVIVGAGISGLAAARGAIESAAAVPGGLEVLVLERDARVGGKAATVAESGYLVETGPTGYLDNDDGMDELVALAGMRAEKVPANAAAARRFLVRGGKVREIFAHPLKFAAAGIMSPLGMLRMAGEPLVPARRDGADESVWSFAARRVGRQAADRLIAPMMLGIFAGDAKKLSLPAAFPRLRSLEEEHGGLVRGMLARRKAKGAGTPAGPSGVLTSFAGGLQTLPERLARAPGVMVRTGVGVRSVHSRAGGGFTVATEAGETIPADAVIVAVEPWAAALALRELVPGAVPPLDAIPCPPVAVVALGYGAEGLAKVPRGFGVLIPRGEEYRILGVLWDTHLFAGRSPEGRLLVRAMLGGGVDPAIGELEEPEIGRIARAEVARLFGLSEPPVYERTTLWRRAIPQYELGHLERLAAIDRELVAHPGLFLTGNGYLGVSFAKSGGAGLARGREAARFLAGTARGA